MVSTAVSHIGKNKIPPLPKSLKESFDCVRISGGKHELVSKVFLSFSEK